MAKQKVIKLICNQQIGDCIRATTVAKLIKKQYPNILIYPIMSHPYVFYNNPNVIDVSPKPVVNVGLPKKPEGVCGAESMRLNQTSEGLDEKKPKNKYSLDDIKENDCDMVLAMCGYLKARYNLNIRVTSNINDHIPDLHLTEMEKSPFEDLPDKYWVVNCGGVSNNMRKSYPEVYWAKLFKMFPDEMFVQIGISKDTHPEFKFPNVIRKIDAYSIRNTMSLVYNSTGVISGYTYIMHVAAAFQKPCIAIGGGGEDATWEHYDYPDFHHVNTLGSFDCCVLGGCWKSKCENLAENGMQRCMQLITPEVIGPILSKYIETTEFKPYLPHVDKLLPRRSEDHED